MNIALGVARSAVGILILPVRLGRENFFGVLATTWLLEAAGPGNHRAANSQKAVRMVSTKARPKQQYVIP